jgi:hypothetical protein
MDPKEMLLEDLRSGRCIDEEVYHILKSFLSSGEYDKNEASKRTFSLISTGLNEDQLFQLQTADLMLSFSLYYTSNHSGIKEEHVNDFNGIYKKLKYYIKAKEGDI